MGLVIGTYPAYCLDQAVWYLGNTIEHEMDEASNKPSAEERNARGARQRALNRILSPNDNSKLFADPAALFQ